MMRWADPDVLAECGRFLGTLPNVKRVPVGDTAIAARDIAAAKDPARAAICSKEAAERYVYAADRLLHSHAEKPEAC